MCGVQSGIGNEESESIACVGDLQCFGLPVEIITGSRLHFGLWALGQQLPRRYGGAGVMVVYPRVRLRAESATQFCASGPLSDRIGQAADRWARFYGRTLPACHLRLIESPPLHVGLGLGTQLALATARLLHLCWNESLPPAPILARSVGRGCRSAVGVYGFLQGGFIVESGKQPDEWLSPLETRVALPESWRFLLVRTPHGAGLSGNDEERALAQCAAQTQNVAQQLAQIAREQLVPAARAGSFHQFAHGLRAYSALAGDCFWSVQGGRFGSPFLQRLAHWLEEHHAPVVGQSSWGPTLYVLVPEERCAIELSLGLRQAFGPTSVELTITPPANVGAQQYFPDRADDASSTGKTSSIV